MYIDFVEKLIMVPDLDSYGRDLSRKIFEFSKNFNCMRLA